MVRRTCGVAAVVACALAVWSGLAWGFWSASGSGGSSASSATLDAAAITVPGSAVNTVTVTWTTQSSMNPASDASSAITYSVERKLGSGGSWAAVASGGCSGAMPRGTTSCVDAPGAAGGYSYRVVAAYRTWTAISAGTGAASVTIDHVAPTVSSIVRADASPSNAGSVHWTVTFNEPVTGVGTGDFALARTGGLTGGSISSLTGTGASYSVTSSTGSGDGTLGLNLVDDDSIIDVAANKLGGTGTGNGNLTGQAYSLDLTAPTVGSIVRVGSAASNASSVQWTVTFSEPVGGVGTVDFALASTGSVSGASVSSVSGTGASYTVTSSTGSGDGTLGLNLVDDDSIADALTNKLAGTGAANGNFTGQTYTIDKTAPTLSSLFVLDDDADGKVDRVEATFSESLAGSILSQWIVSGSVPSGGVLASVSTNLAVATIVLTEGASAADTAVGTFKLALTASGSGIRDAAGNQASFAATAPTDRAGPVPVSIDDTNGLVDGKIEVLSLLDTLQVTFSETILSGLSLATPAITESRAATGNVFLTIAGFTAGALDMGSTNYLTGSGVSSSTYGGVGVLLNKTITIKVGLCSGSCSAASGTGTTMVYRPATTLADAAGNAAAGSILTGFKIF